MIDDLLPQFLFEGRELVQQAGDALLNLERGAGAVRAAHDPSQQDPNRALLDQAFRAVHTLKGSTGLFDLAPMGTLLHAMEDVLDRQRAEPDGREAAPFDALLRCLGACERWLDAIERDGTLPADAANEAAQLHTLLADGHDGKATAAAARVEQAAPSGALGGAPSSAPAAAPVAIAAAATPDWVAPLLDRFGVAVAQARRDGQALRALRYQPAADCFFLGDDPLALLATVPGLAGLLLEPVPPPCADPSCANPSSPPGLADPFSCVLVATLLSTATVDALRAAFRTVPDQVEIVTLTAPTPTPTPAITGPKAEEPEARLLRVDAGRIDAMVDLAGEMLVARNALGAVVDTLGEQASGLDPASHRRLAAAFADIDRLARALRREATGLRLSPLQPLFRRLPRLVREIAAAEAKEVELVLSGGAVELDRSVADRLFEPLLHVLRNAVGHGLEVPGERETCGKPGRGRVEVRAAVQGAQVMLTVSDDGRGIDPERIRTLAERRGLLDQARLAALDDAACLELLFLPGFSTATAITALSGRGVGMDAVREAVSALGGRVGLRSRTGHGTEVWIALPRDVSVSTVLLLRGGGERFAVPIEAIREIVRLPPERVSAVGGGQAFTLRERVLPLLSLARLLGLTPPPAGDGPATVLVAQAGGQPAGFAVDAVEGRSELMVRRLDGFLRATPGVSGTALGPDGRVLMVLDLAALANAAPERRP